MAVLISPLAHVDETALIGDGTRVWQFASVIRGGVLGRDCSVAACAIVDGAKVGDRSRIGHAASLPPGTVLGEAVFIGPGVVVCNDDHPKVGGRFDLQALFDGKVAVRIESGASIGANSVILPGVTIGEDAEVAAGSVVTRNVPAGAQWLQRR